ncbi:DUF4238 domain-containing protein [Rhizobium sp. BR 249]|uniref:DUF4238 domain-containing protein n=1 Tax=Rhizobium sp. BR 249 TaxID=3040011 RepID=UPI0039BF840E
MSKTRDNHYVPQWYQDGFFEAGQTKYRYLDLNPLVTVLPDGRSFSANSRFKSVTSQCFYETDLYTTFFGTQINDEIERRLFGPIDDWGSKAVRAFIGDDVGEWHRHFQRFFEYIDSQRIRTPKGLDWLKRHYPSLSQNQLMFEMQGIQRMNCTTWTEGIREIVSAEGADTKFITSDHPVTVYNYAVPPEHELCSYPNDPAITLKASQTIFPLNKNFCLILTNLEYAKDPTAASPMEKRTFARNFRQSMVRTDAFVRSRKLNDIEVARVNYIVKARARRFIAAGREDWLYPERVVTDSWADLRHTMLPPEREHWRFGGEMYAKMETGEVYYQDQFGRTEKPRDYLQKNVDEAKLRPHDECGCGSGRKYKKCCKGKRPGLRPSWSELSIRERNLIFYRAMVDILGLNRGKDWVDVRRELTDSQVVEIYTIYGDLWPLETDMIGLLPKPDGTARALYTGLIDPRLTLEFVPGSCLYFNEVIMENPFVHPGTVKKEFSPIYNPKSFHHEFLKCAFLFISLMPLIEDGVLNLIPDPSNFDHHLRDQMMTLAQQRSSLSGAAPKPDARIKWLMADDFRKSMLVLPEDVRRRQIKQALPDLTDVELGELLAFQNSKREDDPFTAFGDDKFELGNDGGFFNLAKMAPNFEMAVYLARATGSFIITDSEQRWDELLASQSRSRGFVLSHAPEFCEQLKKEPHAFIVDPAAARLLKLEGVLETYRMLISDLYSFAISSGKRGRRPKLASQLARRFTSVYVSSQNTLRKVDAPQSLGHIQGIVPDGGLTHNNVSRMLITSGVEHHLDNVPMAFFMRTPNPEIYKQDLW